MFPVVVHEGENLRLRCAATGTPPPAVEWRRTDGKVISVGSWQGQFTQTLISVLLYIIACKILKPNSRVFQISNILIYVENQYIL